MTEPQPDDNSTERHTTRAQLLWTLLVFQLKLLTDGLRDVLLSPLALIAVLVGVLTGGTQPDRQFRRLLLWGRRTERWINLFGLRSEKGTADELLSPLKDRTFSQAQKSPLVQKIGGNLNQGLDRINSELTDKRRADPRFKSKDHDDSTES
ncbi:MAG: hypothetical protein ACR2PZ_06175 [Pseudomonadales bacterium]